MSEDHRGEQVPAKRLILRHGILARALQTAVLAVKPRIPRG
jgi:hypothetical protein